MAFKFFDRVQETTTTTGTGTISMGGAVTGYQAFSASGFASGDITCYCIVNGSSWEVGIGTLTSGAPWTMARTTILSSSNAGAAISLSGTSNVWCDSTASMAVPPPSNIGCVRVYTQNGYGSTNTRIRRWTTVAINQGTDITYADSATLGSSFTINAAGVYACTYADGFSGTTDGICITLNDSNPTGAPVLPDLLSSQTAATVANTLSSSNWTGYLSSGSVIYSRSFSGQSTGTGSAALGSFEIVRVR